MTRVEQCLGKHWHRGLGSLPVLSKGQAFMAVSAGLDTYACLGGCKSVNKRTQPNWGCMHCWLHSTVCFVTFPEVWWC
jgi:hypothetical protein